MPDTTQYIANIQHFSTAQGLSHREVKAIFQDRNGMVWIGTKNGLNRFDGYEFKHWLGKNHGVDLRGIWRIGQDDEGWLWLRTKTVLVFFHPQTEEFKTIEERFGEDCILTNFLTNSLDGTFANDANGRIYIDRIDSPNLYTYHSKEGFRKLTFSLEFKHKRIIHITPKNELFFIFKPDKSEGIGYAKWTPKSINKIETIYELEEKSNTKLPIIPLRKFNWEINDKQKQIQIFGAKNELLLTLDKLTSGLTIGDFYHSKDKTWIRTDFGFYIIDIQKINFNFHATPQMTSFVGKSARGVTANSSSFTVAFEPEGIGTYNYATQEWINQKLLIKQFKNEDFFWNRAILGLEENEFWIGGFSFLMYWKNGINKIYSIPPNIYINEKIDVWNITPSRLSSQNLWLGTKIGLYCFDINTKKHQYFRNEFIKSKFAKEEKYLIQNIIFDKIHPNWMWLCTDKGLVLFDEQEEKFIANYHIEQEEKYFLPSSNFQHLYQDAEGIYWLATAGDGLIRWDKKNNEYQQFTIKDGLVNDVIYAVYPDDFGNLWMSSDYGIIKMDKEIFAIESFLLKDGIGQTEFNRVSHFEYRDKKGDQRLFFGGLNGVTTFYPKDFQQTKATYNYPLVLTNFEKYSGKEKAILNETAQVKRTRKIHLKVRDYIHNLQFGLLSYDHGGNNQFSYQVKINGKKSNWTTQNNPTIQLGRLPYGRHELIVKAKTIANVEGANELIFKIIVQPPFYLTTWFRLLLLIIISGLLYFFYQNRSKQHKYKQIELERLVKERTLQIEKDKQTIEEQAEELRNMDRVKSRFFANVTHELRTPLTLMLSPIGSVLKRASLNVRETTFLQTAQLNGKKLLRLVNELLDLSKLESGKLELQLEDTVLYVLVRRIVAAFESYAQKEGIRFVFEYKAPQYLQIELDANKFEIILNNLLSNAFKFTPKGGKVKVAVHGNNQNIKVIVQDTGRGIHPDDLPNIFNRFYQTSQPEAAAEGGTGIGLSLCWELSKLFNGKLWVESESDGYQETKGSTFFFEFPVMEILGAISDEAAMEIEGDDKSLREEKNAKNNIIQPVVTATEKSKTILVVEDNLHLSEYITLILSEEYQIVTARNGKEALELLKMKKPLPNLIISDVMMPIMDGFQLLEKLKENKNYSSIPVIMLTARAEMKDKLYALRIGVDDYMTKPFEEDELLVRINNLLRNAEERQFFYEIEVPETDDKNQEVSIKLSKEEINWLENLEKLIKSNLDTPNFTTEVIAKKLLISRSQLNRKIKQLTGLTPNKYIIEIRLQTARELLETNTNRSVKEISYEVGFSTTEYFSKKFKKRFGKVPSAFLNDY